MHGLMDPKDAAKATTALEKEFGVRALFSSADVTKPAEIRAMIKQTQGDLGSLDILCNNVGIQHVESVVDFPEDK
jgi:3-hydroxybutyrate dehydrogenase